jgi:alanine-glyoxylate transaminase/serine-glyoxylate transaminase/serine-pyruvate transaminase
VWVPQGIDDMAVRGRLLRDFNIEIGGGLGDFKGRIWRVGVMGYSAQRGNIRLLLSALEDILEDLGHPIKKGAATDAAQDVYESHDRDKSIDPHGSVLVAAAAADDNEGMGETLGAEKAAQGVAHRD